MICGTSQALAIKEREDLQHESQIESAQHVLAELQIAHIDRLIPRLKEAVQDFMESKSTELQANPPYCKTSWDNGLMRELSETLRDVLHDELPSFESLQQKAIEATT